MAAGVSPKTAERALGLAKKAPELLDQVAAGAITLNTATRQVKRAAMRQQLEAAETQAVKALAGVYDVVVIDPPWPVAYNAREVRPEQASLAYPTMTLAEIRALQLPLADAAHVWLWSTSHFVLEAGTCLEAWGLHFVCLFVWHKPGGMQPMGLPQFNCEVVLYARKGHPAFVETTAFATCFQDPRTSHSAKPEAFYDVVRRVTAGRRLDMFARRQIAGFDSWGPEAPGNEGT